MKKIMLYQHGGSFNHGCEALVRTVSQEVKNNAPDCEVYLSSFRPKEDEMYNIETVDKVVKNRHWLRRLSGGWFINKFCKKLFDFDFIKNRFGVFKDNIRLSKQMDCCIAIGGDNYCYNKGKTDWATEALIKKMGKKMMLWGCSVEPDDLPGELAEHLSLFDAITVRDSITYEAFLKCGFEGKVHLVADPAFLLDSTEVEFPKNWRKGQMVGINLSPMILNYTTERDKVVSSIHALVDYILERTEMNIVLIPHVRISSGDDMDTLRPIFEKYSSTGRVMLLDDYGLNCRQLKGYISACRFFIGARTHSVIAAYSTEVPTLALGYSVKAEGIARDIFGSEKDLVLPVQTFNDPEATIRGFEYLIEHEDELRAKLHEMMPEYKGRAKISGRVFKKIMEA